MKTKLEDRAEVRVGVRPPGRRGAPAQIPRRQMVDAMLFIAPLEGSEASARAWLEVASVGYFAWRAVA